MNTNRIYFCLTISHVHFIFLARKKMAKYSLGLVTTYGIESIKQLYSESI